MKILLADESFVYRKIFGEAFSECGQDTVVIFASDGDEAYYQVKRSYYDIVVLDAGISRRGVFELLDEILRECPETYVIVTARPSPENRKICETALAKGASDTIIKPIYDSYSDNVEIIKKKLVDIFIILDKKRESGKKGSRPVGSQPVGSLPDGNRPDGNRPVGNRPDGRRVVASSEKRGFCPELVIIAASTGGPSALESIFSKFDRDFPVPILFIQHIPRHFTETLSKNLDSKSQLRIKVAENRESVKAGTAYMAPGDAHMTIDSKHRIHFDDSPPINGLRPAADVLFESVAESFSGSDILVVILTGMGSDGAKGLATLKKKTDCICLVQSDRTCVVYGMPRAVEESGLADRVLDLDSIPGEIESIVVKRCIRRAELKKFGKRVKY